MTKSSMVSSSCLGALGGGGAGAAGGGKETGVHVCLSVYVHISHGRRREGNDRYSVYILCLNVCACVGASPSPCVYIHFTTP